MSFTMLRLSGQVDNGMQLQEHMTGYSGTPLAKKLGITTGATVCTTHAPPAYRDWLAPLPDGVRFVSAPDAQVDVAHGFFSVRDALARWLQGCRASLKPSAIVWVSWPKKASGAPSEISEDDIRAIALPIGFVDVKVCAVDATWSGLKLVVRKSLR